jgi:hypothetical protein
MVSYIMNWRKKRVFLVFDGERFVILLLVQRTSSNPWGDWMGVMHADEIEYVFGLPLNNSNEHTPAEKDLSRRIMKYFTLFAETGYVVLILICGCFHHDLDLYGEWNVDC